MKKFESTIEKILVPVAEVLGAQRHVCAVKDAFIFSFPLTMAGSLMLLLNFVFLAPDGFVAKLFHLGDIFPNLAEYQVIFSPVIKGSTNILAILIVFLIARNLAKDLGCDDILTGLTAVSVFFIIYPDYTVVDGVNNITTTYLGAQGLFVAIIVGLVVGELMAKLSKSKRLEIKMPEQVPPAVARSFKSLLPIMIITIICSIVNFIILKFTPGGIHVLVYELLQKPLTAVGQNIGSVYVLEFIQNLLWIMGIHGPNTIAAVRDTMFAEANNANLQFVAEHGSAWGAPYPVTFAFDTFANIGGSGATLGLVIALFIFGKAEEQKSIAKLSIAPAIFNINEPIIFGLPVVLNPIYIIPFILIPLINVTIGYLAICVFKVMPPLAYSIPWTTPGFLGPFLASGSQSIPALLIGLLCLVVSIMGYAPFVIAAAKIEEKKAME